MKNVKPHYNLVFLIVAVLISACLPQQPVRVLVTPTPQPASETPLSTATDLATETQTDPPAVAQAAVPTATPAFLGAIVGPSYTPPVPTVTPLPSTPTSTNDPN